jgi:nicotinate-nucleotide adenylyltransferase
MTRTSRVGILGGTFDPIHCGHLDLGDAASSALALTEIIAVTANIPPHRPQPIASSYHRFAMVVLALADRERWRASDLELSSEGPSFTARTLQHFRDRGFAPTELCFIVGADAFAEIETWMEFPAILDRAHFAVVSRPGHPVGGLRARLPAVAPRMTDPTGIAGATAPLIFLIDAPTADVSSTAIRRRLAAGEPIADLVPPGVRQHIERHGLYTRSTMSAAGAHARPGPAAGRLHGQD